MTINLDDTTKPGFYHLEIVQPPGILTKKGQEPQTVKTLQEVDSIIARWFTGASVSGV